MHFVELFHVSREQLTHHICFLSHLFFCSVNFAGLVLQFVVIHKFVFLFVVGSGGGWCRWWSLSSLMYVSALHITIVSYIFLVSVFFPVFGCLDISL